MSLYRKYRPQKFIDLVGQDHIKQTLTNALKSGKFGHAYLFWGPKGSGKTTTARLLAKALNCQNLKSEADEIEPCDKCSSCLDIVSGRSMDVLEIDAASNRGIDEIRELRDKIRFAPTAAKFKVYVIDECHMLTKEAFNALLKTLEEPPAHAIFILATTEIHKVPATILSRTQVFDFRKARLDEIDALLKRVAKAEKLAIDDEALSLIGRLAFGAYRDAVSMLDQVASLGGNKERITLEDVQAILGQATEQSVWELVMALASKDREAALNLVEKLYFEGADLENFIANVVRILRKLILFKAGMREADLSSEDETKLQELEALFNEQEILAIIEKLIVASRDTKTAILGQLPLEMAIFELTHGENSSANKLELDANSNKKQDLTKSESTLQNQAPAKEEKKPNESEVSNTDSKDSLADDSGNIPITNNPAINNDVQSAWSQVVNEIKIQNNTIAAMLGGAQVIAQKDGKITLAVRFKFHADQICNSKNLPIIETAVLKVLGEPHAIECVVDKEVKIEQPIDHEEVLVSQAKEVFEVE